MNEFEKQSLNWSRWTAWASMAMAVLAYLAFADSASTNKATLERLDESLKRMDLERSQAIRPLLSFQPNQYTFALGDFNRVVAKKNGDGSIQPYLWARNVGEGAATEASVRWEVTKVWTKSSGVKPDASVTVVEEKAALTPALIPPGESCGLFSLPTFVMGDHEKQNIRSASGTITTTCVDIGNEVYRTYQEFHIDLNYGTKPPTAVIKIEPRYTGVFTSDVFQ